MSSTRAEFHRQHVQQASAEARRLFERKTELQGAWLNWVAAQLYALGPAEYVSMVRRELQQLQSPDTH
ncbi:hypothetical protein HX870_27790 [Pseudomonas gingeri]|uniref:Uncharacterized protein n=1 Tax=Pseudomonas gingeri TaxID=117681 RepID=A0A7Y8C4R1_9PSED|nr:hypothetical protein [Pseudomonas gingeri]NWA28301.1 hypothetical protein [Pseudomonas gingeri]NWB98567.1 hypothetical protein [Pseudomonas gingeri]NWD71408.1 hypothetical protein [Pseudomonas gingeri]NWD72854.1 hypothetical protein [Pseudomonas gingeri]